MKQILVCGAGGFIGSHLVNRLKSEGHFVIGADLKYPEFSKTNADKFYIYDLRELESCRHINILNEIDEVYQLAADMGGAEYVFTGEHDANIIHNSAQINLNICEIFKNSKVKIFYSSSACCYSEWLQTKTENISLREDSAWTGKPDSVYGIEKLFSETVYESYHRNYGLDIRIARFHNIFGERGTYDGIRAKAPAALSRKISLAKDNDSIEVFGDGKQVRSFLYINDCLDAVSLLMQSNFKEPLNIGSTEVVSINDLAQMIIDISGKKLTIKNIEGIQGVRGRSSDNALIEKVLNWKPKYSLQQGLEKTFWWINSQVHP